MDKSNGFFPHDFFMWTKVMVYIMIQLSAQLIYSYLCFIKRKGTSSAGEQLVSDTLDEREKTSIRWIIY